MPHKFNPNFAANIRRQKAKNIEIRVPRWWHKELKAGKAVLSCPRCRALFYDKHWHTWSNASVTLPAGVKVREELCRACRTLGPKRGNSEFGYEGEVILSGLNDQTLKREVINTAKNIAARALLRDPEDQIIKIEDNGRTVRITTTENQLAVAIGKEIDRAHKGGELNIRFSEEDLPARVFWKAK